MPREEGQRGQAGAPGQQADRVYVHQETGEQITAPKKDSKALKEQGYRPLDEDDTTEDAPADQPAQ